MGEEGRGSRFVTRSRDGNRDRSGCSLEESGGDRVSRAVPEQRGLKRNLGRWERIGWGGQVPGCVTVPRLASDWISLAEAVDLFASANIPISRSTLARWASKGKLQSIRPGRRIYVRRAQVRQMLQPRRHGVPVDEIQPGLFEDLA